MGYKYYGILNKPCHKEHPQINIYNGDMMNFVGCKKLVSRCYGQDGIASSSQSLVFHAVILWYQIFKIRLRFYSFNLNKNLNFVKSDFHDFRTPSSGGTTDQQVTNLVNGTT